MKIRVQKFGGASLSTAENRQRAVQKILQAKAEGDSPVVVVSAFGQPDDPYATDTLVNLAQKEYPALDGRELDMIMSCGEVISGVVIVAILKKLGADVVLLNGQQAGITTTEQYGDAKILRIKSGNILQHVERGKIVVITGFQGISEFGEITTLGRGGSDTSAVAIGAATAAASVDIYSDVDGIMTADPRIVPTASTISHLGYEEAYQMTSLGARKAIHPRAVELAMRHNLPIRVRSIFDDNQGTVISNESYIVTDHLHDFSVVGITCQPGYGILRMYSDKALYPGNSGSLFKELAQAGCDRDFISVTDQYIDVIARQSAIESAQSLTNFLGVQVKEICNNCAKVSLVGCSRVIDSGLFSTFVDILHRHDVHIFRTYTGPFSIFGIVAEKCTEVAIKSLHEDLF